MTKEAEILAQAKKIMDEFISALNKVKVEERFGSERKSQTRAPSKECINSSEFRKRIFKNAIKTKDDFFLMEKKEW